MDIVHAEKYYKQIQERYPDLNEWQIDNIVKYGLRSMWSRIKTGGDVLFKSPFFMAYFGMTFKDMDRQKKYAQIKRTIKARFNYSIKKPIFNGKYYFCADKAFYDKVYPKNKKKVSKIHVDKLLVYKIYDEAKIWGKEYIFEIDHENVGYKKALEDCDITNYKVYAKKKDGKWELVSVEGV